jgi:hypothetical protein
MHEGSASIGRDPIVAASNALSHERNLQYYRRKWGGDAGQERYQHPFHDPNLGPKIAPESRHAPYGKYDRIDIGQ